MPKYRVHCNIAFDDYFDVEAENEDEADELGYELAMQTDSIPGLASLDVNIYNVEDITPDEQA